MKKFYFLFISLLFVFPLLESSRLHAQCLAPTQLSVTAATQNSVTITWAATNSASHYNIRYQTAGSLNWTVLNNVSSPLTLTGLNCASTYVGQLQQVCYQAGVTTPLYSDWANITFTTFGCTTTSCPAPSGLVSTNISQTGVVLNLSPAAATNNHYNIRYHSGNTTTWTTVTNVTLPYQLGSLPCGTGFEWQVQQVCAASTPGATILSPWSAGSTFSTLTCSSPCDTPTGPITTNISHNGAVLSWNPNIIAIPTIYNIRYHSVNSNTWITVNNVSAPYYLTNLECGVGYIWQVQQVCTTNSAPSAWTTGTTFVTLPCSNPCVAPTALTVAVATQNSVILNWAGSANGLFNIRYHGPNATWTVINNVPMPYELVNLPCGSTFEWQVQQICSTSPGTVSGLSPWSVGATFTTTACSNPCLAPTGQTTTNITQNGAVLNWVGNTLSNNLFNIRYHSSNSDTWIVINNVTSPYQLGNLACATGFVWQVQQVCSTAANPSPWSVGSTFSTLACPNPCVVPTGLITTNISQTGAVLSLVAASPVNNHYNIRYHSANSTWIAVNNITFPYQLGNLPCGTTFEWQAQQICGPATGTTAALSPWSPAVVFTTLACPTDCPAPTQLSVVTTQNTAVVSWAIPNTLVHYNVQYHVDGNPNWTVLTNVTSPLTLSGLNCGSVYVLQVQQVCTNSTGVASVSQWSNVTFTTLPCQTPCAVPTALSTTNISQTGAVLHWGPTASNNNLYNIRYHSANSATWIVVNNVTMPYQLGNLACGTGYVWQVQQVCNVSSPPTTTTVSPWSVGATFTTLGCQNACATPVGLAAANITQSSAVLYWGPTTITNGLYNIRYHAGNSTTWITINNVTLPYQLGNLTCGTSYEWQVQRICSNSTPNTDVSPWSTVAVFHTLACPNTCTAPTGLSATNITQSSAVLNWGPIGTSSNLFNIRYRTYNTTVWTTVNNISAPYQLSNLNCSAGYVWQVQRICGTASGTNSQLSPWSVSASFGSLPCQISCAAPTGLSANDVTQTTANLHWGAVSGAVAYIVNYRPLNNTSPFITITTNTNSITISGLMAGTGYVYQVRAICANGTVATNMSPLSAPYVFATASALVVFPNPVNDTLRITANVTSNSTVTLQLRDSYGQLVMSENEMATGGLNEFKMDTSTISAGMYLLTIRTNTETITTKVFVMH